MYESGFNVPFDVRRQYMPRGELIAVGNEARSLKFHYNPEEVNTDKQVNWATVNIPGSDETLAQFASGGSTTIPLRLFLNDFGETSKEIQNRNLNTQDAIAFLQEFTTRASNSTRRSPSI